MKKLLPVFWFLLSSHLGLGQKSAEITQSIDRLLASFVKDGLVDYQGIAMENEELNKLCEDIGSHPINFDSDQEQKAFLINAYNVFVIKQVVDNLPLQSPQEKADFFTEEKFQIGGGEKINLNQLEKELIFVKYDDPRLHFALVCAAQGCPKIRSEAYTKENLESLLDDQSKIALNDISFSYYKSEENSLKISKIFDWYKSDFGSNQQERIAFVNKYSATLVSGDAKINYIEYDWTLNGKNVAPSSASEEKSNLQIFTPSALFTKGEFEVNTFNSIYSQQERRDDSGEIIDVNGTENFFTSMIMFTTGVSKTTRFNVGFDVFLSRARTVRDDVSAFDVFKTSDKAVFNKSLISYIAPRIKWVPLKDLPRLSIQSALWVPVSDELETEGFVAHDRYTWFTQIFFDKNLGDDFQIFLEVDLLYRFANQELHQYDFFRTPASAFLSYFPTSRSTFYVFSQYSPRFERSMDKDLGLTQWFAQFGIGGKYQITEKIGVELSYSDFALSRGEGAGNTLNFGIRYIHR
ncbi:MAG: DUF547 domain-containing protein [Flavobacteriales bacterium]|nr:DUF547 domain-containing protein [Flavobacteriales bacterium]